MYIYIYIHICRKEIIVLITSAFLPYRKSISALGNCVSALSEGSQRGHVPFRDSKLTRWDFFLKTYTHIHILTYKNTNTHIHTYTCTYVYMIRRLQTYVIQIKFTYSSYVYVYTYKFYLCLIDRLLTDAIGGNSRAFLCANVGPCIKDCEEVHHECLLLLLLLLCIKNITIKIIVIIIIVVIIISFLLILSTPRLSVHCSSPPGP